MCTICSHVCSAYAPYAVTCTKAVRALRERRALRARPSACAQGEREVKQALRRALLKYKLHTDQDLFDKSYGYIRQYY